MKVIEGLRPDILPASVVTVGMFDGVHRGHQALLHDCRRHADARGVPAVALTYHPHPTQVLHPEAPVRLLTPLPEKLERLAEYRMDYALIAEFTREFSLLTPEQFLRDVLVRSCHPAMVVVGYRTTFGHGRAGTAEVLCENSSVLGFTCDIVEPIEVAGGPVSSTRIRRCLEEGDVVLASELLGYPYRLTGRVVPGDERGRTIGIPTANIEVPVEKLIPAQGVYVGWAGVEAKTYRAVMNIGDRPTFGRPYSLEAHLLDFTGNIYEREIAVHLHARLRDIQSFSTPAALVAQIREDIARARDIPAPEA
ncbi:MAG: bifunctional riboflavin kinase/FAD synthetase [Armatimonadota bacterium]